MAKEPRADKQRRKRQQKLKRLERHPPRLGHESMMRIPAFREAAAALTDRLRGAAGALGRLVSEQDFEHPLVDSMLRDRYALMRQL